MNEPTYLTAEGLENLKEELAHLKGPKRKELAKRLRIAIDQGDLKENADYIATKEEQGFVEGRIQELEYMIRNAVIIEKSSGQQDIVDLGTQVTIQEDGFEPETYHIVGKNEANPREGRISNESPIGEALMGKRVGDDVQVKTPNGKIIFTVVEIK